MAVKLGKHCAACGAERRKTIKYDSITFTPYCSHVCCVEHPNSPENVLKNQRIAKLLEEEEAQGGYEEFIRNRFKENPDIFQQLDDSVGKPIQIRIPDPNMAIYIAELMKELNLSLSETIRYCINFTKENFKNGD